MAKYVESFYEDGKRLEQFGTIESNAKTALGFLRLFYKLNSCAAKGKFSARLHDDGADILSAEGNIIASYTVRHGTRYGR